MPVAHHFIESPWIHLGLMALEIAVRNAMVHIHRHLFAVEKESEPLLPASFMSYATFAISESETPRKKLA